MLETIYKVKEKKSAMKNNMEVKFSQEKILKYALLVISRQAGKGEMNVRLIKSTNNSLK